MKFQKLSGGYLVDAHDSHICKWQIESDRLDHDMHLVPIACEYIKAGMHVLDAGAFNGDHSIAYRRAAKATGKVICLEANPRTFPFLEYNMELQDKVELFPIAQAICVQKVLCATVGNSSASFTPDEENHGATFIKPYFGHSATPVEATTIDHLMDVYKLEFGFVKLDIEGYEVAALLGARKTMAQSRPVFMIEINEEKLRLNDNSPAEIWEIFEHEKYHVTILQPQCTRASKFYDILAFPL